MSPPIASTRLAVLPRPAIRAGSARQKRDSGLRFLESRVGLEPKRRQRAAPVLAPAFLVGGKRPAAPSAGRCARGRRPAARAPRAPPLAPWRSRRSAPRSGARGRRRPTAGTAARIRRRKPARPARSRRVFRASRPPGLVAPQGVAVLDQPVRVFAPAQHVARRRGRHAAGRQLSASRPEGGRRRAPVRRPPPRRCSFPPATRRSCRARPRPPPLARHWRAGRRRRGRLPKQGPRTGAPCRRCVRDRRARRRRRARARRAIPSSRRARAARSSARLATGPCNSSARSRALAARNCSLASCALARAWRPRA